MMNRKVAKAIHFGSCFGIGWFLPDLFSPNFVTGMFGVLLFLALAVVTFKASLRK